MLGHFQAEEGPSKRAVSPVAGSTHSRFEIPFPNDPRRSLIALLRKDIQIRSDLLLKFLNISTHKIYVFAFTQEATHFIF